MHLSTLFTTLLLGAAAVAVLVYLLRLCFSGFQELTRGTGWSRYFSWQEFSRRRRLEQRSRLIDQIEQAVQQNALGQAQKLFRTLLDAGAAASAPTEEGLELLRRILRLADQRSLRLTSLPLLEDLLLQRQSLIRKLAEAQSGLKKVRSRSKRPPSWAETEFAGRAADTEKQLETNGLRLLQEFTKLLEQLRDSENPSGLTIH